MSKNDTFNVSKIGQRIFIKMANVIHAPLIRLLSESMFKPIAPVPEGPREGTLYQYFPVIKRKAVQDKALIDL